MVLSYRFYSCEFFDNANSKRKDPSCLAPIIGDAFTLTQGLVKGVSQSEAKSDNSTILSIKRDWFCVLPRE